MSKDLKQIEAELDSKIPRDVVQLRDGGGGRKLSYLTGHYVIDRLNKIFGPLNWSKEITEVREVVNKTSRGEFPAYLVKVRLSVTTSDGGFAFKDAYGYGADKSSQNAHELAIKEAVTDALKVAAKDLGMSLGLALYDPNQENVDDGESQEPVQPQRSEKPPISHKQESVAPAIKAPAGAADGGKRAEKLRSVIQTSVKIALKKGRQLEEIKKGLQDRFSTDKLVDVADDKLDEVKKYIDSLIV